MTARDAFRTQSLLQALDGGSGTGGSGTGGSGTGALGAVSTAASYYFLSELLRCPVCVEGESIPAGTLVDLGIVNKIPYPVVASLKVRTSRRGSVVRYPWSSVFRIAGERIVLKKGGVSPVREPEPVDVWLQREVLDDQVIDISGARVLRVNDLQLLHAEGQLLLVHVDVGIRGVLRRLRFVRFASALLRWLFDYELKDNFVSWRFVELANADEAPGPIRVAKVSSRLGELHPAELADILEQLGTGERYNLMSHLPLETAAETLEEVDPELQRTFISEQEPAKAADYLEEMESSDAADLLRDLHESEAQVIIGKMEREAAENIRAILVHEEKSAGGIMSTRCMEQGPEECAGGVLDHVRSIAGEAEVFSQIYVVDSKRRLLGVVSVRELLMASPDSSLREIMTTDVVSVRSEARLADVAKIFVKYGFRAVPVVDDDGSFLGAIRLVNVISKLSRFFREE